MTLDRDRVREALPAYEVGGELGRGGWGIVLEGRHRQLDREVAIKQLPRAFAADPAVRTRFVAEARVLASLDHPHIVPVFDFVESDGLCLLVMEKLPGGTVWSRFTSNGLTAETSCALVLATCAGLHAAHQKGILHRDVKPENLLFSASGALKVADFGIAKVVGGEEILATRAGDVLGTPAYMAPEQAQGSELGPATDVYAVAVMLYELLSGRLPFPEDSDPLTTLYRHVHERPSPLTEVAPGVPSAVAAVVMKGLATNPVDRYDSAEAFGVALAEAATGAWMPGWPADRGQVAVMGSPTIVAATERSSSPAGQFAPAPAPPTVRVPAQAPVRASVLLDPLADEKLVLVPVREMVSRPPFPVRQVTRAGVLAAAAILVGLLGLGSPSTGGNLPPRAVQVGGADPASGGVLSLDLESPIVITGNSQGLGTAPDAARIDLSLVGAPLGSDSAPVESGTGGSFSASIDLAGSRYLAAGEVTGTLSLLSGESLLAEQGFRLQSKRSAFLTLPGFAAIAALLFLTAYSESILKSLRRGRRLRSGRTAMVVLGGALGPVVALLGAFVARKQPGVLTFLLALVVGAGAGHFAGTAGAHVGRFRRLARARRT